MTFTRVKVNKNDIDDEKKILTALIIDKTFHETDEVENGFFSDDYMNIIAGWCKDFYKKYKQAPGRHIQDIYEKTSTERSDADNDLMEMFFEIISDEYSRTEKRNTEYVSNLKRTLQKKKEIKKDLLAASAYYKEDNFDEIYSLFKNKSALDSSTVRSFNPLEEDEIDRYFSLKKDLSIMEFDDPALKEFFDHFERGWVVSFLAPEKGGKSFILEEMNFLSMKNNLNTAVFSIELNEMHYKKRKYERLTMQSDSFEGFQDLPFLDCKKNQNNNCDKAIRSCNVPLGFDDESKIVTSTSKYQPCTVCKGSNDYLATSVLGRVKIDKLNKKNLKHAAKACNSQYHGRSFVTAYPTFSASMNDISSRINHLESKHGIVFDAILIDYPDITLSDKIGRDIYDDIWKKIKRIATEKNVCVFAVEQGNKDTNFKDNVDQMNTSEDKRKNGHIDVKYTISMTKKEMVRKTARLSCALHRHMDADPSKQLLCCRHHVFANPFGEIAVIKTEI